MRFSKGILLSAATFMLPFLSHAATITPGLTLATAGLTFNNFQCAVTGQGSAFPGNCGAIDVQTINNPRNGIQISSGFTAFPQSFSDATINYHVNSVNAIHTVGLEFNGTFHGYAISSVTESVFNAAGKLVGFASVSCAQGFLGGCERTDDIVLSGLYNDLYIRKDINVSAFLGEAQISYVNQTFGTVATPEPASVAMLGTGLLGLGLLRRRAKATAQKEISA